MSITVKENRLQNVCIDMTLTGGKSSNLGYGKLEIGHKDFLIKFTILKNKGNDGIHIVWPSIERKGESIDSDFRWTEVAGPGCKSKRQFWNDKIYDLYQQALKKKQEKNAKKRKGWKTSPPVEKAKPQPTQTKTETPPTISGAVDDDESCW